MKDLRNYNLLSHNTFGIDVECNRFVSFETAEEIHSFIANRTDSDLPTLVIGEGSNLLFTQNYPATILHSAIKGIETTPCSKGILVRCGSGEHWDDVVDFCVSNGWSGLENMSYIPGTVGASAVQNIGAYGSEAKDVIYRIEAIDLSNGESVTFKNEDCNYSYRKSNFKTIWKGRFFITHVTYLVKKEFQPNVRYGNIKAVLAEKGIEVPTLSQLREVIIEIRKSKLPEPSEEGNAGSFFMNPIVSRSTFEALLAQYPDMPHYFIDEEHEKVPAGWLIEQCGWKGKRLGNAGVHAKQALVLVNKGGASGNEVLTLCNTICNDVQSKFGITIHPEVNIL
ncbi:MAG: UDP-N-acetylmuramate dehydrogenase [Prevotella nanceiensis]|uniref:UDP-N-acetylmuramate dehydrogenase n=1 Tax=Hoylesella nanceiensis TaxID=425941 RepID=UPI001CADD920|nr:UDP-N-acetylmuramate dehydrogenase [Hoylesella nanceiensis]MBF1437271.1 UDP-N-acetylmuramate dehydrogenase [Hoylesella nanceiensis]